MSMFIYTTPKTTISQNILDFIDQEIVVVSDGPVTENLKSGEYCVLNFYNVFSFVNLPVVFIGKDDYNLRAKDLEKSRDKKLFIVKEDINRIEALCENTEVFILEKNLTKIRKAKNAELHSILR